MPTAAEILRLSRRPLKLSPNRVWRTYAGGRLLERWQGRSDPRDGDHPEAWVASCVEARNPGREHLPGEGLSRVRLEDGRTPILRDLIVSAPAAFLGAGHTRAYGANPAVLVKALDAAERLQIQVHPDRDFARRVFQSAFGKTEAWYVLGGRETDGEAPHILMGFKPGMTPARWRRLFERQDIPGMTAALHRIAIRPGDVFLVEGGVPHAIGAGCFLIEIQEPTDFTLRTERTTLSGRPLPDIACHQGAGFDRLFECFHYDAYAREETLTRWKRLPAVIHAQAGGTETRLIGPGDTDRFSMHRLDVSSRWTSAARETFHIALVVSGAGEIRAGDHALAVAQADEVFLPAGTGPLAWERTGAENLQVVLCFPPPA